MLARATSFLISLFCTLIIAPSAFGQMFSYGPDRPRAVQSVSFVYANVDFNYNGDADQTNRYDYDQPAYGIRFARSGFDFTVLYGVQDARTLDSGVQQTKLNYVSADLLISGRFGLYQKDENLLFVPIGLYSGYKVVGESFRGTSSGNEFNFTAIALGAGLGFTGELSSRLEISGQALPSLGFASRSVQGLAGNVRSLHVSIDAHLKNIFGRFGLSLGYGLVGQDWRINSDNFLEVVDDDIFDYTSLANTFRLGINF